ncbi:Phosphotransferase family protein [Metarhizium album ARSEF 1941]|uniref:Phosphotransferase family protein n=1 Tax=Metarhizium album (strain ARSEF 1941) TaxID=1081103 RepID=A0A0B2WM08_METAS|nr:Phosphotransferase family protein [Metarhizium album ARSEF 1941]KHN94694.1 Phosphotransferase family protein [Metarhizium album ARSEF 1941]
MGIRVLEHTTSNGGVLALKVKPHGALQRSEADMMQYAATHAQEAACARLGAEKTPGESLDTVWDKLTKSERKSIKNQLHSLPTTSTIDWSKTTAGRLKMKRPLTPGVWIEFKRSSFTVWKPRRFLDKARGTPNRFVLTHCDLTPRNIMAENGRVTGIVDWERSGFFPEYAEYAFAMKLCHEHEKWWIPVLKDLLVPCEKTRLDLTEMVEYSGW